MDKHLIQRLQHKYQRRRQVGVTHTINCPRELFMEGYLNAVEMRDYDLMSTLLEEYPTLLED